MPRIFFVLGPPATMRFASHFASGLRQWMAYGMPAVLCTEISRMTAALRPSFKIRLPLADTNKAKGLLLHT